MIRLLTFFVVILSGVAMAGDFEATDANSDGFVSMEEAAAAPGGLSGQLVDLDVNKDGKLDQTEFSRFDPASPDSLPPSDCEIPERRNE